jgi:predicted transport protein
MTLSDIEKAMSDKSISDKKFFKILLGYLDDQEAKDRKSKKDISSVGSPGFQKREAETNRLRKKVEKLRPTVMELMRQHVSKQHEHCYWPKNKR